jgi:hypothetical protein
VGYRIFFWGGYFEGGGEGYLYLGILKTTAIKYKEIFFQTYIFFQGLINHNKIQDLPTLMQ